ncbi:universal stress protein [Ignicoccus pacificus DSM 13166]|uniref:Universal stress protein n=1 Tax=Ignicoccus pacificus DSM 13166 TaxID=940294 RepID=A0A977KBV9_9CREN|nr:universal stress protein [Ignicoccus pacificus DSM 13166]
MDKLLLAYDGSEPAKHALEVATDLAKKIGAKIYILYVVDVNAATELFGEYSGKIAEELMEKAKEILKEAMEKAKEKGVEAEEVVEAGTPAEKIVDVAKKIDAYMIVMGAHGYSGIKRLLIGSVSEKVIRMSDRPVLIVKNPKHHK